ncbi:MAG: hypothetical protein JNM94_12245 [Phycisphaerae bacterium]|nr:hypothetical protein [Phycisphaerae bacterium]
MPRLRAARTFLTTTSDFMTTTPTRAARLRRRLACVLAAGGFALLALAGGCDTEKSFAEEQAAKRAAPRPDPVLVVRNHVGGTHHRVLVRGYVWYATFANNLLTIDSESGTVVTNLELMPFGSCGGATEIAQPSEDLVYILLDGTAVCEVSLANPRSPTVVARRHANEIGFAPRAISAVDGEVYISGDGGVVRWSDVVAFGPLPDNVEERAKAMAARDAAARATPALADLTRGTGPDPIAPGPVVRTAQGLAAPVGRRVHLLGDGSFIGAATRLDPLPSDTAANVGLPGGFSFILQASEGAQVGLMNADVREAATITVKGVVRRVRVIGNVFLAITDNEFTRCEIVRTPDGVTLGPPLYVTVKGARDIDRLSENYFAVVGSFGRAIWRRLADDKGPGDEFVDARREPSNLVVAATDRRRILAGGPEGSWLYTIGDEVERVNRVVDGTDGRKPSVSAPWGRATVSKDARSVEIRGTSSAPAGTRGTSEPMVVWQPVGGGEIFGVESADGRLWVWHESGIDAMTVEPGGILRPDAAFRIEGPVRYLFPQRIGGAVAYVSQYGGFGLLDFIARSALPETTGPRILDRDGDGDDEVILTPEEAAASRTGFESAPIDKDSLQEKREDIKPRE